MTWGTRTPRQTTACRDGWINSLKLFVIPFGNGETLIMISFICFKFVYPRKDDEDVAEEEYDDDKSGRDEILTASSPEHVGGNEEGRSVIKVKTRAGLGSMF